jgi:hypothetical protein
MAPLADIVRATPWWSKPNGVAPVDNIDLKIRLVLTSHVPIPSNEKREP